MIAFKIQYGYRVYDAFEDLSRFFEVPEASLKIPYSPSGDTYWVIEVNEEFLLVILKSPEEPMYEIYYFDEGLTDSVEEFLREAFEWNGERV